MISNIHRNIMGTASFDGLFQGMRKPQDFIVYPMHAGNSAESCTIQSDTRIGKINLSTGEILMSKPRAGGAYGIHMMTASVIGKLSGEELLLLKAQIFATANAKAGTNGIVYTDNSAAAGAFQSAA